MKFRIKEIEVVQIGPFGRFKLTFPEEKPAQKAEVHILTGENGTGKTTLLELLTACFSNGLLPTIVESKSREPKSGVRITFNDGNFSFFQKGDLPIHQNAIVDSFAEKKNHPHQFYSFAVFAYSGYRRVASQPISGIQELKGHPLENALDFKRADNPSEILQWIANNIAAEAIAKAQQDEKEAVQRRLSVQQLEETVGQIIDKKVQFRLETKPYSVKIEVDGERLEFNHLPDGLKSIVSWLVDLLMRMDRLKWVNDTPVFERNFLLFLDEIEVHTHPAWQRKILPVVQRLFPNAQIFISTHSPFVVGSVDGAWIYKLVKPNGDSQLSAGYPMRSEDARSYRYWLEEVFDVASEYGMEAEQQ